MSGRRKMPALLALLAVCAASSAFGEPVAAAEIRPLDLYELGAPTFATFSSRDGLPESVITDVEVDGEGFVWAASPDGLARWDGQRFRTGPGTEFADGAFSELYRDREGTLWAAFRERGVAALSGGSWRRLGRAGGLPSDRARRVLELPSAGAGGGTELWLTTMDGHLARRQGARWVDEPVVEALAATSLLTAARTRRIGGGERLWVGTGTSGLWFREEATGGPPGPWTRLRVGRFDPGQVEALLASEEGGRERLWVSTFGSGLWRIDEQGVREWSVASGDLPSDQLYELAETHRADGTRVLWAGSRSGLVRVDRDRAEVFDRRHGLPSNVVRGLTAWRSPTGAEVLWLATEAGVARTVLGASRWTTASLLGASGTGVFGVMVEPDGDGGERLWVLSSGDGIGLFERGRWRRFDRAVGGLPIVEARRIVRVPDAGGSSTVWLGLAGGDLLRILDGPRFEPVPTPWEKRAGEAVLDILGREVDGRRELWVATRHSGLHRLTGGAWESFGPPGVSDPRSSGPWRVVRLVEQRDRSGRAWLWASSNRGLARFDGERWELLRESIGLPEFDLIGLTMIEDAAGRPILWAGSGGAGVLRIDVSDPLRPVTLDGSDLPPAPDPVVYSATGDAQGRVYVCSNDGVQLLTPVAGRWSARTFTRRDGMVHEECNTNAQLLDAHGRFWTGTLGGLAVFDPEQTVIDRRPKPLRLTGVTIDGEPAPLEGIRLGPRVRDLRVDFALLAWQREGESRFRTQLVGHEPAAGDWTAEGSRRFGSLPAGSYVLRVEGRDHAGNESRPLELAIEIVPYWWNTLAARLGFVLLMAVVLSGLVTARTRSLRSQRRRLESEVADRTSELHRANERLVDLSYKDALTGLANRRRLLETLESMPSETERRERPTALVFVDVDHFKAYNDRFGHPAGDEALRGVAAVLREEAPADALVARYGGEEFACLLLDTELEAAVATAERMRSGVATREIPVPGTGEIQHITLSAGVAALPLASAADPHRLLRDADIALYQAKRDGRDCVRAAR